MKTIRLDWSHLRAVIPFNKRKPNLKWQSTVKQSLKYRTMAPTPLIFLVMDLYGSEGARAEKVLDKGFALDQDTAVGLDMLLIVSLVLQSLLRLLSPPNLELTIEPAAALLQGSIPNGCFCPGDEGTVSELSHPSRHELTSEWAVSSRSRRTSW